MKSKLIKTRKNIREQILESTLASFKIEGIIIPKKAANDTLKKVSLMLGK